MKAMKLYQKLKECDLVVDEKDFTELVWLRAIQVNGKTVDNPLQEIQENETHIKVGVIELD